MGTKQTVYIENGKVKKIVYEYLSRVVQNDLGCTHYILTYKRGRKIYEDKKGLYIVDKSVYGCKRRLQDDREEVEK